MKNSLGPTHILILTGLFFLILAPRPIAGVLEVNSAARFEATGDHTHAASAYISAAQRLPWQPSLLEKAADAYLEVKDYSSASQYYGLAFRQHALSPSGSMGWGDAAFALGDPGFAVDLWKGLADRGGDPAILLPRIAHGYQLLATASAASQEFYTDEIQTWQKYLVSQPGDAAACYRLGLLLVATSPADALPELMQAARLDPDLQEPVQGLRTALNTAFLSDNHAYQFLASGQALGAIGQWDLAAEAFRNALRENAGYAEAWAWAGLTKQELGQDGSTDFSEALTLDANTAIIQGLYGLYLQRQGNAEQALAAYEKAASLEPDNPGWQMALGNTYEQTGDLISAYSNYLKAVQLAPQDPSTWRALATFSINNGVDVDLTGLPAASKLVELAPDDWQSYDLEGQAAFLLEDYNGAEKYLKKAIQLDPTQAAPVLHLALVYLQNGAIPSAYSYLNLAKEYDPNGAYGWQAERLLEQYFP